MTRESAEIKGRRLLIEGRLNVYFREGDHVNATCRGDSGAVYKLSYDPKFSEWTCSCPALGGRCSHRIALKLVVAVGA